MKFIVEIMPPEDRMSSNHESNIYAMSAEYLERYQAEEAAKAYKALGCSVRILRRTIETEVIA